jgi:hypothetical protein
MIKSTSTSTFNSSGKEYFIEINDKEIDLGNCWQEVEKVLEEHFGK